MYCDKGAFFSQKKEAIFHVSFQFFQTTQQAEVFFCNIQDEKPVFKPPDIIAPCGTYS